MKRFLCVLLCFVLCSCVKDYDLNSSLDLLLNDDKTYNVRQNNYTDYLNYYLPSDVYEIDASILTHTFIYNNSKFVINVNVAGIINNKYYESLALKDEGFFDNRKLIYSKKASFMDIDDTSNEYFINIYQSEQGYLIHLMCNELNVYGNCTSSDLVNVVDRIMLIVKSCSVNNENVVTVYSTKDVIDYQKVQVNLFESIFPVEGRIDDLMIDSGLEMPEE